MVATHPLKHYCKHALLLIKIHVRPAKYMWDLHDLVGPMWISSNQRVCVD